WTRLLIRSFRFIRLLPDRLVPKVRSAPRPASRPNPSEGLPRERMLPVERLPEVGSRPRVSVSLSSGEVPLRVRARPPSRSQVRLVPSTSDAFSYQRYRPRRSGLHPVSQRVQSP